MQTQHQESCLHFRLFHPKDNTLHIPFADKSTWQVRSPLFILHHRPLYSWMDPNTPILMDIWAVSSPCYSKRHCHEWPRTYVISHVGGREIPRSGTAYQLWKMTNASSTNNVWQGPFLQTLHKRTYFQSFGVLPSFSNWWKMASWHNFNLHFSYLSKTEHLSNA